MKPARSSTVTKSSAGESRPLWLAVVFFILGAGIAGFWFHCHQAGAAADELAFPIRNLLNQLPAPAAIRYYSLLPADSANGSLQAFSGRVTSLLNAMQTASGGKLQITIVDTPAGTNADIASANGIQPFNLDKGEACFLGATIVSGKNQEVLPRLRPEWEPALQYDLARAIERVTAVPPPPMPAPEVSKPSPEIISSIHELIPDVNATSLANADQIFRDDFVKQCIATGQKFQEEINAATEQVTRAQGDGSAADEETARKHLQELQLAQGEKLKALASRLQVQLAVFQQMKSAATNTAK